MSVLEATCLATKLRSREEPALWPPVPPKPVLRLGTLGAALIIPWHPAPGTLPGSHRATRVGSIPTAAQDVFFSCLAEGGPGGREPPPHPPASDPPTPPLQAGSGPHRPPLHLPRPGPT